MGRFFKRGGRLLKRGGGFLKSLWRSLRSSTPSRRPSLCLPDIWTATQFLPSQCTRENQRKIDKKIRGSSEEIGQDPVSWRIFLWALSGHSPPFHGNWVFAIHTDGLCKFRCSQGSLSPEYITLGIGLPHLPCKSLSIAARGAEQEGRNPAQGFPALEGPRNSTPRFSNSGSRTPLPRGPLEPRKGSQGLGGGSSGTSERCVRFQRSGGRWGP